MADAFQGDAFQTDAFEAVSNATPNAPTLVTPADDATEGRSGHLHEWTFSDPDAGDSQSAFALKRNQTDRGFVAASTPVEGLTVSSITGTLPAGAAPGMTAVAIVSHGNNPQTNTPVDASWVTRGSQSTTAGSNNLKIEVFTCTLEDTHFDGTPLSLQFNFGASVAQASVLVLLYKGLDRIDVFDVLSSGEDLVTDTTIDAPTASAALANARVLRIFGTFNSSGGFSASGDKRSEGTYVTAFDAEQASPGAAGAVTGTCGTARARKVGITLILNAAQTEWWNGSAWVASETYITDTDEDVTFAANTWPEGVFDWTVRTKDAAGAAGAYATPFTLNIVDAATIDKSFTDTGEGSDALSVEKSRLIGLTDTGSGSDDLSVDKTTVVAKSLTDTGEGTDDLTVEKQKFVGLTDEVVGTDALSVQDTTFVGFTETGSGSDALSVEKTYAYQSPEETEAHMSASLREATPSTPDPQTLFVRVDGSSDEVKSLLGVEHGIEAGKGTEVIHAELILTLAEDMPAGTYEFTVKAIDEDWDASTVTYSTSPSVRAATATVSESGLDAGDEVAIDITDILSGSVSLEGTSGEPWFGLELTVDGTDEIVFYGAYSIQYRPRIIKEVSRPPAAPFNLRPTSGLHVSELKPYFAWDFRDLDNEDTLSMLHFQLDTTDDFETPSYDSGEVASTTSFFDSNSPPAGSDAFANLTNTNSYYWRARHADSHGLWSEWSDPQLFTVTAKGTFTLDAVPTVPTPTISWTLSVTQQAYNVVIERYEGGAWVTHWEQPWTTGTATEVTLADAYVLQEGVSYRATVRVTDTTDRASLPGDLAWYEDSEEFEVAAVVMA